MTSRNPFYNLMKCSSSPHWSGEEDAVVSRQQSNISGPQHERSILQSEAQRSIIQSVQRNRALDPPQQQMHVLTGHSSGAQSVIRGTALLYLAELQRRRRRSCREADGSVRVLGGSFLGRGARLLLCEVYADGDLLQTQRSGHQTANAQIQLQSGAHMHLRRRWRETQLLQLSEGAHAQSHMRLWQTRETRDALLHAIFNTV